MIDFRQITLRHGLSDRLHVESPVAFRPQDLRDLVVGLLNSGMLEFHPVEEGQELTAVLRQLVDSRR